MGRGGPLFDIGPYYLTALVQMFGPAVAVAAIKGGRRFPTPVGQIEHESPTDEKTSTSPWQ